MTVIESTKRILILECIARPRLALAEGAEGTKGLCSGLTDIKWFSEYAFPPMSGMSDPVNMKVTGVSTGKEAYTDECNFTVAICYEENYGIGQILSTIRRFTFCRFKIRDDIDQLI